MLNNFCFHVYAQKSVFIGQNVNAFLTASTPPDIIVHRAGSQLKTQKPKKLEVILFLPAPFFGGGTFLAAGGQLSKFPLKILATLLVFRRLYNCAVNNDLSSVCSQHLMKAFLSFPI